MDLRQADGGLAAGVDAAGVSQARLRGDGADLLLQCEVADQPVDAATLFIMSSKLKTSFTDQKSNRKHHQHSLRTLANKFI